MSDPRPDPDSSLTPAEDDAVRALLASARHTDATPPDVVARLEAAIASLSQERHEVRPETRAPVVTLASRRRRTAATALLAAAAVVVFGVGIGQLLPTGGSDDSAGGSAESATSAEDRAQSPSEPERAFGADSSAEAEEKQGATSKRSAAGSELTSSSGVLTSKSPLAPQVRALRRLTPPAAFATDPACPLPGVSAGTVVSVTYDGTPGALVLRPPVGATQRVDVFLCGQRSALRSLRLRAP